MKLSLGHCSGLPSISSPPEGLLRQFSLLLRSNTEFLHSGEGEPHEVRKELKGQEARGFGPTEHRSAENSENPGQQALLLGGRGWK